MNALSLVSVCALVGTAVAQSVELNERERAFERQMSGCQMVGFFTANDAKSKVPQEDRYTISKVTKLQGDTWRFDAKIEYGKKSVSVPVPVQVVWAGDTPTIQVTELGIPMLGKFSARVVIYDGQYAGLWSGEGHGGHMYGEIRSSKPKAAQGAGAADWRSWRGNDGSGAAAGNPPVEWSEDKNIRWKVELPGVGLSTPIAIGDTLYMTTAIETDEDGKPPELPPLARRGGDRRGGSGQRRGGDRRGGRGGRRGGRGGRGGGRLPPPTKFWEFEMLAVNRSDGSVKWRKTVNRCVPHEGGHSTGSQSSGSAVTDGEMLYANFGSRGVHALTLDGELKWSKDLGYMRTRNNFGEGSSPAVHGNVVVVNWDHEADSFVVALDTRTGEELWRNERDEPTSWSTPLIVEVDGKPQVVITATNATRAYGLTTGDLVWSCKGMTLNAIPTPIHRDGVAYLMSGFRGSMLQAITLKGARGDISDSDQILWKHTRSTSYVPSALLYDDCLYFLRENNAVLTCLDAAKGQPHYEGQRLSGLRTVYASPVGAAGRVYVSSREGITKVFKAGREFEELATNELDDQFDASAVVLGDEIYLRGRKALYCIAEDE